MPQSPPTPPKTPPRHGVPTQVWFVQGKKANRSFNPPLRREDATLHENKENIPPNDKEENPQRDKSEEEKRNVELEQYDPNRR